MSTGDDEAWSAYLGARDQLIIHAKELAGISASEEGNPKEVPYWPIPSQMVAHSGGNRKPFIKYLYNWYYKSLSQDAHFAWAGVARSLPLLMNDGEPELRSERIEILRSRQVAIGLTLMMAIMTELEIELRFGLMERCKYVWAVLSTWSDEAKEPYERFYRHIVGPASAEFPQGAESR
jgi:hypothetical protein